MNATTPVRTFTYAGRTVHEYRPAVGEGLPNHVHDYGHLTYCLAGRCLVRKEGREFYITPESNPVELRANEWHEIEAVEPGTLFLNIFATKMDALR